MVRRTLISIIIPTYNRPDLLQQCLISVLRQSVDENFDFEIVIAQDKRNAALPECLCKLVRENNKTKAVRAEKPGVNAARNAGIKESRGDIIYFLDDDCKVPTDNWVNKIYESFINFPDACAIGGGYILENKMSLLSIFRNALDNFYIKSNTNPENEAAVLIGGNCGYRRDVFERRGLFDENIPYGGAETEMNDRIYKNRGKMRYDAELSVFHLTRGESLFGYFRKSFRQGWGNAYSNIKNDRPRVAVNKKTKKLWFIRIVKGLDVAFVNKLIAAAFLFLNSIVYWVGFFLSSQRLKMHHTYSTNLIGYYR